MAEFVIHDLTSGGGCLGISPLPGRAGRYLDDVQRVLDWRPDLVITVAEMSELERHDAGRFERDLASHAIAWHHVPVVDFGTPDLAAQRIWPSVETAAVTTLCRAGRVLVHCYGGCGRSGMALLRIMRAAGEDGEPALHRLRQTRPCAIETEAQLAWGMQR